MIGISALRIIAIIAAAWLATTPASAQRADRSRAIILRLESGIVGRAAGALRVTRPSAHIVNIMRQRSRPDAVPRQRGQQLSEDHLVVVATDRNGREISRTVILDPRLVRAEAIDGQGHFTSRRLFRQEVEFPIALPDDDRIVRLQILHPRWTGSEFILEPVGEVRTR